MHTIISVDAAGRIVLPKRIRDQYNLVPGSELELNDTGDNLTLRPISSEAPTQEKQGFLVYTGEFIDDSATSVARDRQARLRHAEARSR